MRPRSSAPWAPYVPDEAMPWNLRRVVHLHRRAGFAATWEELQRDLKDGPPSVDQPAPGGEVPILRHLRGFRRVRRPPGRPGARRARLRSPQGLVGLPHALWPGPADGAPHSPLARPLRHQQRQGRQLDLDATAERDHARALPGPFRSAFCAPCSTTRRCSSGWTRPITPGVQPNENLARELMELFTLGIGSYSETDVKQAARALTGWRIRGDEVRFIPARHDQGTMTILGRTALFDSDGLAALLLDHPATSQRLAWRLCHEFFGEGGGRRTCGQGAGRRTAGARPSTLAGESRRCCGRGSSSTMPIWADASPVRLIMSWARCGPSKCSTRRRARPCWPSGAVGWARISSIRPTSAAGPEADPGLRPAQRSDGPTSPRLWSTARKSAWTHPSTRSRWPPAMASDGTRRSSRNCCSGPMVPRSRSMRSGRPGRPLVRLLSSPSPHSGFDPFPRREDHDHTPSLFRPRPARFDV